jgi:hypothetical protein
MAALRLGLFKLLPLLVVAESSGSMGEPTTWDILRITWFGALIVNLACPFMLVLPILVWESQVNDVCTCKEDEMELPVYHPIKTSEV